MSSVRCPCGKKLRSNNDGKDVEYLGECAAIAPTGIYSDCPDWLAANPVQSVSSPNPDRSQLEALNRHFGDKEKKRGKA